MVAGTDSDSLSMPWRLAAVASLAVSLVGVAVFGSVVAAVGDWVEGRELETVAPWAIPGLALAVVAGVASIRALVAGDGRRIAFALNLLVALSLLALLLRNPSIAPAVP